MIENINLHFEILPSGRIKFNWQPNDVRLLFYNNKNKPNCVRKPRKASTIRAVGEAFIRIAEKAKELEQYQ